MEHSSVSEITGGPQALFRRDRYDPGCVRGAGRPHRSRQSGWVWQARYYRKSAANGEPAAPKREREAQPVLRYGASRPRTHECPSHDVHHHPLRLRPRATRTLSGATCSVTSAGPRRARHPRPGRLQRRRPGRRQTGRRSRPPIPRSKFPEGSHPSLPVAPRAPMLSTMFAVSEAQAAAIRSAFDEGGEFSAAIELRRIFPAVTGNATAREYARVIAGRDPAPLPSPPAPPPLHEVVPLHATKYCPAGRG